MIFWLSLIAIIINLMELLSLSSNREAIMPEFVDDFIIILFDHSFIHCELNYVGGCIWHSRESRDD